MVGVVREEFDNYEDTRKKNAVPVKIGYQNGLGEQR